MSDRTAISWTTATWNPVVGCMKVSPGCTNCYAERMAVRLAAMGQQRYQRATVGNRWSGYAVLAPAMLGQPLHWLKPRRIFVCSMSDLFHDDVQFEYIAAVFGVMAACPQHTFQVLTKRPQRMLAFFQWLEEETDKVCCDPGHDNMSRDVARRWVLALAATIVGPDGAEALGASWEAIEHGDSAATGAQRAEEEDEDDDDEESQWTTLWPLPNVWVGVTVENQGYADERIPLLLQCPAVVRWVSYEPALGPVQFWAIRDGSWYDREGATRYNALTGSAWWGGTGENGLGGGPRLDWVVAGGESGGGARPAHPDWFRLVRDGCEAAGVAFHFKQWGEYVPKGQKRSMRCPPTWGVVDRRGNYTPLACPWTSEHDFDGGEVVVYRVGKKAAGRLLDGVLWDQYPTVHRP